MPHSFGLKARTGNLFYKGFRRHGNPNISTLLTTYKTGEYVDIVVDSAFHKGMPAKYYHGRTGKVFNVSKRSVSVLVHKRVRGRITRKKLCIRPEHIRKSRCQEELKERIRHNEMVKRTGVGKKIRRLPALPRREEVVRPNGKPLHLGARKFVFSEVYDY
eukprot:NODE_5787_length_637_cov_368.687075_g5392_i0.p1 GENE.NODE_5787_length_637_cov_368.687075_g5392_i0~~NODE_5787_length_637_cov_368.687075_g5392_i0.p1  ORF type:complete len:160 (-),score=21.61 NODE_5787_length_637_cov_368.687075_g5392_i0:89-568(-)